MFCYCDFIGFLDGFVVVNSFGYDYFVLCLLLWDFVMLML